MKQEDKKLVPTPFSPLGDWDQGGGGYYKRPRCVNSAPPFVGSLPFRLREDSPSNAIRLTRISETYDCEDLPSDNDTEELPDSSPCPRDATSSPKRDPDETESDEEVKSEENRLCEFSKPCRMDPSPDGMHYRKIVSHVFGRNKASTKLFPDSIWVHYCRKHYQRARYRADQWPFTQCDLLIESLSRMEEWGGVDTFELTLRRREVLRVKEVVSPQTESSDRVKRKKRTRSKSPADSPKEKKPKPPHPRGRKHPTAIVAPVPDWMLACLGKNKSFEEIRAVITAAHDYMREMSAIQAREKQQGTENPSTPTGRKVKQPVTPQKQSVSSTVRFPDIEILPTFKPWVHIEAQKKREAQGSGTGRAVGSRSNGRALANQPSRRSPTTPTPASRTRPSTHRGNGNWRQMVSRISGGKGNKKSGREESKK